MTPSAQLVSLTLTDVGALFEGQVGDPAHGQPPQRSGVDRLYDLVEPSEDPLQVLITLPEDRSSADVGRIGQSLASHATSEIARLEAQRARVRRLGLKELVFGLAFLAICLAVSSTIAAFDLGPDWLHQFLVEGLVIIGWIALWHPVDMLFFERLPLLRDQRILRRLQHAKVDVETVGPAGPQTSIH